ncbi:murein biosynthesis integral membrane protein MurJ [Patescibacteria group bacterium]
MRRILSIFNRKQTTIGSAAFILMIMVFTSRMLGLVRDRMLTRYFIPDELGVYFAAFRLPNLLFELLVMGALTTAFIPVFTRYITKNKKDDAHVMASTVINIALLALGVLLIPLLIWTEQISMIIAPGFTASQISQMVLYTRILLIFQVIPLMIGNFFTGILQSYKLFLIPAIAPVIYNAGVVVCIALFASSIGLFAPVLGVVVGAVLFMLIQLPLLHHVRYRHKFSTHPKTKGVREVITLMIPRTFGLAVAQIDTTVDIMLASMLGARMVTIFHFAQHLQHLPVGLFGATIAQAALPSLSQDSTHKDTSKFKEKIITSVHQIMFFVLPISALFIILRIPIVRIVFGSSQFDWDATVLTSITLACFSVSLFAQSISHVFIRGFYALYDSKTPVFIGVLTILTNTFLSIMFIKFYKLPVWSLGLSTTVASIINVTFLYILLDRRIGTFSRVKLFVPIIKMIIATSITSVMLYIPLKLMDQLVFDTTRTFPLLMLTGFTSGIGLSTYFFLSWVFGVGEVYSFIHLMRRVRRAGVILLEPEREVINGGIQDKIS